MEKAAQSISSSWSAYKQRDQTEKAVYKSEITTDKTPWKTQNSEGCVILITVKNETSQLLWVIYG